MSVVTTLTVIAFSAGQVDADTTHVPDAGGRNGGRSLPGTPVAAVSDGRTAKLARRHGLTGERIEHLSQDHTFLTTSTGELLYVEPLWSAPSNSGLSTLNAPTVADVWTLASRPESTKTLLLDFDGHDLSGTAWVGSGTWDTTDTGGFDMDGDPDSFNATEKAVVQEVWERVSEDFAPFDINVTTHDPGIDGIRRDNDADHIYGTRVVITERNPVFDRCRCGGIAYVGTFDDRSEFGTDRPAFVFTAGVTTGAKPIADVASHEAGHTLGLYHDGVDLDGMGHSSPYYAGHGPWGPLMGSPYARPLTVWSNGNYRGATNAVDDFAVIAAHGAAVLPDDHGNSPTGSTYLGVDASFRAPGVIGPDGDIDVFSFHAGGGSTTISVSTAEHGANLDVRLVVRDRSGRVVAESNPPLDWTGSAWTVVNGLDASIDIDLPAGLYSVEVDGTGSLFADTPGWDDYGVAGRYMLALSQAVPHEFAPAVPEPPRAVVAERIGDDATFALRWTDQSYVETAFDIGVQYYAAEQWTTPTTIATVRANDTSTRLGLDAGTARFVVRATGAAGPSAWVPSHTVTVPLIATGQFESATRNTPAAFTATTQR